MLRLVLPRFAARFVTLLGSGLLSWITAAGQTCPASSIVLDDQSAIDTFPILYPGCDRIAGDLIIRSDPNSVAITNLDSLVSLVEIDGSLLLDPDPAIPERSNRQLVSLAGLDRLERIGNDLVIRGADSLRSLEGLGALRVVGGRMELTSNPVLESLAGMGSLERVGETLFVGFCASLSDLSGLRALDSIGGALDLQLLPSLTSLQGLDELRAVGGGVKLFSHDALASVAGLRSLATVGAQFRIADCARLANLDSLTALATVGGGLSLSSLPSLGDITGLSNLSTVGGALTVRGASSLTSLAGLDAVRPASISRLAIVDNPQLSTCALRNLCEFVVGATPDSVVVEGNADSCATEAQLTAACERSVPTLDAGSTHELRLYPNPTTGVIYYTTNTTTIRPPWATVYDLTGREVLRGPLSDHQLDLTHLPAGIYTITIAADSEMRPRARQPIVLTRP